MAEPLEDWMDVTRPRGVRLTRGELNADGAVAIPSCDAVVLVWVLDGVVAMQVDDERFVLEAGALALLPEGSAHVLSGETNSPTVLRGEYSGWRCPVTSVWAGLPSVLLLDEKAAQDEPRLGQVGELLAQELDDPEHGSQPLLGTLMDALMMYVIRAWSKRTNLGASWMAGLEDPMLLPPLRALHQNPAEDWTVERMAQVAGVSRAAFARHFADRMGEPPMQYVRRWRMAMATRLLLDGDAPVSEVAERVGYSSEFAFNRAFRRVVGKPPGRFRKVYS